MRTVQVLGAGCPKCRKLAANAEAALRQLGLEGAVEKVTDIQEIVKLGVLTTPALRIDGEVKAVGNVPGVEAIVAWLRE